MRGIKNERSLEISELEFFEGTKLGKTVENVVKSLEPNTNFTLVGKKPSKSSKKNIIN